MVEQPLIQFHEVSVRQGDKQILQDLSFAVSPGERVVLSGPSGSGKSSVLQVLLGFLRPTAGTVFYHGSPHEATSVHRLRREAATVLQEPVPGGATVLESLRLPFTFKSNRHHTPDRQTITAMIESLGLPASILDHPVADISGGEKQRVALARGLLLNRDLLLLDEITSALDAVSRAKVITVLAQRNYTVLSVAHDPVWIGRCDRIIRLEDGRMIGNSPKNRGTDNNDNH
ncbi:MAG: ATP-binding cassette domain-containing protein [Chitinispirillaceae bacterium]|nr:ATP-binding cassette domain-containing protein [Chitinispirillaceae bacterium]